MWANIEPTLVALMEEIKEERVKARKQDTLVARAGLLRKLVDEYATTLPVGQATPSAADIVNMPAFKSIMETPLVDDWDDTVTADSSKDAFSELPALSETWREAAMKSLRALLPAGESDSDKQASVAEPLDLATSLFSCSRCGKSVVFHWEQVLGHAAAHNRAYMFVSPGITEEEARLYRLIDAVPWTRHVSTFAVDAIMAAFAAHLVELCGGDVQTMTTAEMDALDHRFTCDVCQPKVRNAMSWRAMVSAVGSFRAGLHKFTLLLLGRAHLVLPPLAGRAKNRHAPQRRRHGQREGARGGRCPNRPVLRRAVEVCALQDEFRD